MVVAIAGVGQTPRDQGVELPVCGVTGFAWGGEGGEMNGGWGAAGRGLWGQGRRGGGGGIVGLWGWG